jgi:cytochrome c oxidase cbb3-type subunit III
VKTVVVLAALALALVGCEREDREYRSSPATTESIERIALSPLSPGAAGPEERRSGQGRHYEENAYHIAQGKRLYAWYNCNGCHSNGGGGSGPPLMDDRWIYGSAIENIVQTIREGRPNGMPSFRGRVPDDQIWQLAAYVRSMGRYVPKDAAPGRNDDMHPAPAELRRPPGTAVDGGSVPPSGDMPQ